MTKIFVDGVVQDVAEDDPMFHQNFSSESVETTRAGFEEASKTYDVARRVKRLKKNSDFKIVLQDIDEQVERCANVLLSYIGNDETKVLKLWREYRDKKITSNYLHSTIEEAEATPRPVLQEIPQ